MPKVMAVGFFNCAITIFRVILQLQLNHELWRHLKFEFVKSLHCADHHPIRIGDERERLVTTSPVMTKSRAPAGGNNYPENVLVKPPRCDTRALSPAGMFGGKAPLRSAAKEEQTSRAISVHAQCACLLTLQMGSINQTRLDTYV